MQQFEDVLGQPDAQAEAFGLSAGAVEHLLPARTLQDSEVVGAFQVANSTADGHAPGHRRHQGSVQAVDFRPQFQEALLAGAAGVAGALADDQLG